MRRRLWPRPRRLLTSLTLFVLLFALATYAGRGTILRWYQVHELTSANLEKREKALNYIIRRGRFDAAAVRGAVGRLDVADPQNFLQIVNALDAAGQWRRPTVPPTPWVRWLNILANAEKPEGRLMVARYLGELTDIADDPGVIALAARLQNDENDDVRYNALVAAAGLAVQVKDFAKLRPLLVRAALDASPDIARQGWIFLGLFKAAGGVEGDARKAVPRVAEAMLWAAAQQSDSKSEPAIELLNDVGAAPERRAAAAYALAGNATVAGRDALLRVVRDNPAAKLTPPLSLVVWRAVLAVPRESAGAPDAAGAAIGGWARDAISGGGGASRDEVSPIIDAACYRLGAPFAFPADPKGLATEPARDLRQDLADLATMEGVERGKHPFEVTKDAPDVLRLAAVDASKDPRPDDLRPLFDAEEPATRDAAVVVAAERFTKEQNATLIDSLLHDYNDHAKIAGAMLAGLTGQQHDLLAKKMADEDVWSVKLMMKIGLWMQGRGESMDAVATGLYSRDDIPKTTLTMALLHLKNPVALDYLLNPRGEPPVDLINLFDEKRWWRVLSRFLPRDAPPFWVWADPALERFQLDVLRDWYLVNRAKVYK